MSADDRLTRLRALIDRLERLPASPESEWMLREARARMVDVETGERPGEMRPLAAAEPPEEAPRRRRAPAAKRPAEPRSIASEPLHPAPGPVDEPSAPPFGTDGLLWLEDSPSEDESRPWRRGLRG